MSELKTRQQNQKASERDYGEPLVRVQTYTGIQITYPGSVTTSIDSEKLQVDLYLDKTAGVVTIIPRDGRTRSFITLANIVSGVYK